MVDDMISEFSKLTQKEYKNRHDWAEVIHWELCKKLKFHNTYKCTNQNQN